MFEAVRFGIVAGAAALAVLATMLVTAGVARRVGRVSVVDTAWGLGFVLVAIVAVLLGDAIVVRRLALLVMVGAWGLRLASHVARRNAGKGEDPRYAKMLDERGGRSAAWRTVWLPQGLAMWFVSLPVQVGCVESGRWGIAAWFGAALWALGMVFESVGDRQLAAFKADPANKGKVMDKGLWSWTRHPNYFGDACVWWGIYLVAADAWPGMFTFASPALMTYFLVFATGARLLEQHMRERPGYREYAARTSMFLPLPPRSR